MWYNAHRSRDGSWVAGPEVRHACSTVCCAELSLLPPCLQVPVLCPVHMCVPLSSLQVPRDPLTGRIAAFVALHGHGVYPQPGRVLRHFLLGNDLCSRDGPVWRPQSVVLLPPRHQEQEEAAAAGGAAPGAIGGCHAAACWLADAAAAPLPVLPFAAWPCF